MRIATWLGYGTLLAACVSAFRVLILWMTYRYFWINAWSEVLILGAIVAIHVTVRPKDDPKFRKITRGIVVTTLILMAGFLVVAFNLHIA